MEICVFSAFGIMSRELFKLCIAELKTPVCIDSIDVSMRKTKVGCLIV
jgi:hypothetical protein